MANTKEQTYNSLQLSIATIVQRTVKRDVSFLELDSSEKREVLDYIKSNNLDFKTFGYKWYDILTRNFFAVEYLPKEFSPFGVDKITREFDSFTDFFSYVQGDIYQNSCFYGYNFTQDEINKFQINYKELNFDSLINETIDDYTFESLNATIKEENNINAERSKDISKWFEKLKPITTLEKLKAKYKQFTERFDFLGAGYIFFSILLRKQKHIVEDAAIQFLCHNEEYSGLTFGMILSTYGRDAALYVIDHYVGTGSVRTQKKRIKNFKSSLEGYENGAFAVKRNLGFNESLQLYYVKDKYLSNKYSPLSTSDYFFDFSEFSSFVQGDLSNADLLKAPVTKEELAPYKTNESTKFPLFKKYKEYKIEKTFAEDRFIVNQKWIDGDGFYVLLKRHEFEHFFDFVHFLKRDLSNADLLLCNGLENIGTVQSLRLDGVKVRSDIAEKLKLPLNLIPKSNYTIRDFELTSKYELQTDNNLLIEHPDNDDYSSQISYISDIHLLHRFEAYKCRTVEDRNFVIRTITNALTDQATSVNLIGGDTSSDFEIFKMFIRSLATRRKRGEFFFTLGNHELWGLNGDCLSSIITKYKTELDEIGKGKMHLIQNNIFYADDVWKEITEEELSNISPNDLRLKLRSATVVIFGGIGFSGKNIEFNANNGIYMNVVDRETEIAESKKFFTLYEKVTSSLEGKNLIVLTHMPMKDWGGSDIHAKDKIIYVNGHNHRNYFYDDNIKRIYADNQIGYKGKRLAFKHIAIDFNYDWFADYKDGIYEITESDYKKFYRGIRELLNFNREYDKLFMIKRDKTYMFFMKTLKGTLLILNGGSIKKTGNHSLEYYYDNLIKYSTSVRLFLSSYNKFQKQVSKEVKMMGGNGNIHGSIIDIDFYNHLYLNPLDGSITPYFADSMVDKYVYNNLPSLLKYQCPELFANYEKIANQKKTGMELTIYNQDLPIQDARVYICDTSMYKISRLLKGLQFTTKYNIVRLWNDEFVSETSEENGRLIVSGIIYPVLAQEYEEQALYEIDTRKAKTDVPDKKSKKTRDDEYKTLISKKLIIK